MLAPCPSSAAGSEPRKRSRISPVARREAGGEGLADAQAELRIVPEGAPVGPVAEGQPSGAGRVARVLRWQSIDLLAQTVPCALVAEEAQGQRFPRLRQLGQPMGPAVRGMLKTWTLWLRGQPQDEATRRWLMDFNQVVQAEIRKIQDSGKQEGLRTAVRDLCEVLGIVLTAAQQAHLDSLDLDGLGALRAHLKSARSWPLGS